MAEKLNFAVDVATNPDELLNTDIICARCYTEKNQARYAY